MDAKLLEMVKNKFWSYVIEVVYKSGGGDFENRFIMQLIRKLLKKFLKDELAHYLVQTMLTKGEPENRVKFQRLLLTIPDLRELKYWKFVINLL